MFSLCEKLIVSHYGCRRQSTVQSMKRPQLLIGPVIGSSYYYDCSWMIRNYFRVVEQSLGGNFLKHVQIPVTLPKRT